MNNSTGKSPQFGFSRCKLSPLFHSVFSPAIEQKVSFADFIDTKLIHSGRMLNKVGKIERPDLNMLAKLSDMNTSQKQFKAENNSSRDQEQPRLYISGGANSNAIFSVSSLCGEDIRCPVPKYNFKSNLHNKSTVKSQSTFEPSDNSISYNKNLGKFNQLDKNNTDTMNDFPSNKEFYSAFTINNACLLSNLPKSDSSMGNSSSHSNQCNTETEGNNNLALIQSSIVRGANSNVQMRNMQNGITIINNNNVTINNYPQQDSFIGLKRQRMTLGIPYLDVTKRNSAKVHPAIAMNSVIDYYNSKTSSDPRIVEVEESESQDQATLNKKNFKIKKIKMKRSVGHRGTSNTIRSSIELTSNEKQEKDKEKEKFIVEANKMTKKILEESLSANVEAEVPTNEKKIRKERRLKKTHSNDYNIQLVNTPDTNISIFYQYLLEKFHDTPDPSCYLDNETVKTHYLKYKDNPKNSELKLTFGDNPLTVFQDYASWLKEELKKEPNEKTKEMCNEIAKTLNMISCSMSKLPILICPKTSFQRNTSLIKKKNKKIFKPHRPKGANSSNQKEKTSNEDKKFKCDFCQESFATGQGLGGHMSRKHKDKSEKFKKKKEIRNNREHLRNLLINAKKALCERYMIDFEEQMKTREGKQLIKDMIFEYSDEYKKIRLEIRKRNMAMLNRYASEKKK